MDYWTYAVGQIVGDMNQETSVRNVFAELLNEYADAMENLMVLMEE
jgi:hypothetical protein